MQKKIVPLGVAAVLILSALLAFLTMTLSAAAFGQSDDGDKAQTDEPSLVGTWVDNSTGVDVTYTQDGIFKLQGGDVANYTQDKAAGTVTLRYAEAYGGEEKVMSYAIDGDTLTLTETDTGITYTYNRQAQ